MLSIIVLIFCEIAPKSLALRFNERFALALAGPVPFLTSLLRPLVGGLSALSRLIVRAATRGQRVRGPFVTEEELKLLLYVGEQEGIVEQEEREMIHGILEMTDKSVREVMVPRVDVVAAENTDSIADVIRMIIEHGYSRIPIYEDNIDNIVGVVYAKDLLRHGVVGDDQRALTAIAREPYFTPEAKHVGELLREMKERKVHIAMVVDEHGGTAGIVTFEDLIEEIVGPIRDEYDMREVEELQIVSDHEVVVSARYPAGRPQGGARHRSPRRRRRHRRRSRLRAARGDSEGRRDHPAWHRNPHRRGDPAPEHPDRPHHEPGLTGARARPAFASTTTSSRRSATPRRRLQRTLAASSAHDGRMPTYTDEGIVLRRIDYGESDRILTVLTLEHGKIGVIARGVRKSQSRLASRTDLFTRSRMQLARGRGELDVLTQAESVAATPVRSDARRAAYASLCAELSDRVLESHHAEPEIYALVAAALSACADPERDPRAAIVWFARRMVDRLGYAPQLLDCASL